jgi:hypothetical protein
MNDFRYRSVLLGVVISDRLSAKERVIRKLGQCHKVVMGAGMRIDLFGRGDASPT